MEELLFLNLKYIFRLEYAQLTIWCIQQDFGKEAAIDWMHGYLARFN